MTRSIKMGLYTWPVHLQELLDNKIRKFRIPSVRFQIERDDAFARVSAVSAWFLTQISTEFHTLVNSRCIASLIQQAEIRGSPSGSFRIERKLLSSLQDNLPSSSGRPPAGHTR